MASQRADLRIVAKPREGYFLDKQVAIWCYEKAWNGKVSVATNLIMSDIKEGEHVPETMLLNSSAAQELMDSLWTCGFRPSEGTGSAGALAAVQYHLEDMRKLVFEK